MVNRLVTDAFSRLVLVLVSLWATLATQTQAASTNLWTLGAQNGNPNEFGGTTWLTNAAPGSASVLDDDYYFAGSFPSPINTVAVAEPLSNLENAVTSDDPINRIHFTLSATQAVSTLRIRMATHIVWGGWWNAPLNTGGVGYGSHTLEVRLNGQLIGSKVFTFDDTLVVSANAGAGGSFTPIVGANVLELRRAAGTAGGYVNFDDIVFDIDPLGAADGDGDGMKRWYEDEYHLDDANAADAAQDPDADGSTNAQEFTRNTNPRNPDTDNDGLPDGAETVSNPLLADTDGDGISDGMELAQVPPLNPIAADTDGDGAPDGWELRTGYAATIAANSPPAYDSAIGVNFIYAVSPTTSLGSSEVTGLVPQMNWNNTRPLAGWSSPTGATSDIASPLAGTLVNAAGAMTSATISWQSDNIYFSGNSGGPNQKLMDGYLNVVSNTPATLTVSSIPYTTYDVLVYVGAAYDGADGYVRLNNLTTTDRYFETKSTKPQSEFIEPVYGGVTGSTAARPWSGNVVRFRNVTGASVNVKLHRVGSSQPGIHGIQLVKASTDGNGNGLPDWWELEHRLPTGSPADADGDGLTNLQEFNLGTNPQRMDTDGDALSDLVETNTGIYVSPTNTGSNPLLADTDGDTINDGAEVATVPSARNPNVATTPNLMLTALPVIGTSSFVWDVSNLQLVWDHGRGHAADNEWDEEYLLLVHLRTSTFPDNNVLQMGLRIMNGKLVHFFSSRRSGAFSAPNAPNTNIWDSDYGSGAVSLLSSLGFSGAGTTDISDRLQFRLTGTKVSTLWNLTFEIRNLDTGFVKTKVFNSTTLHSSVTGSTVWQDDYGTANRIGITKHAGLSIYQQATALETTPAFSAALDTDEDGMTDAWELANLFNINSTADALQDTDGDGRTNLAEFLVGTNPRDSDSDDDGASDGVEFAAQSNPLNATSLPPYFTGVPSGALGEDLNGNGLPDAWELLHRSFSLSPNADSDGDGQTNVSEATAGTNPFDASSRITSYGMRQDNDFLLCWPSLLYKQQRAWESTGLSGWTLSAGSPVLVSGEYRHSFPGAFTNLENKFFRVGINNLDTDNDGVSDWAERLVLQSSHTNANSLGRALTMTGNTTMSGDYAALLNRFQGANSSGGFPGAASTSATSISKSQAARFLMQATFGPTPEDIEQLQSAGYAAWIADQVAKPATLQSTYIKGIVADFHGPRGRTDYVANKDDNFIFGNNLQTAFARAAIQGQDQLRQRVAFALSQICVVSRRDASLENQVAGMADYYDIFVRNAFGNYHDILRKVALHPCMGRYLSHVGNQKANPSINQYPDENFAREVMQLFSIGLWELNPDGSRQVNGNGQHIPTYGNAEITQLARVFTGLWFSGHEWGNGGWFDADYSTPMTMHAQYHDFGSKTMLNGFIIPVRAATPAEGMNDVDDAIRHLFEHHNTGPFICRQLIQFLVSDNPSPGYIQRVGSVFANNGAGVRGDLRAVVETILLDQEARDPRYFDQTPSHGRLKEPVIRTMAMGRAFGLQSASDLLWWDWGEFYNETRQAPSYSPSVFNFYRPDYLPAGILTTANLAGPVFQITDSYSCIAFPNALWRMVTEGMALYDNYQFPLNLARESALAGTPEALLDHLNLVLCAGGMSANTRTIILNAITQIPATLPDARARVGIYLTIVCPEAAIMK